MFTFIRYPALLGIFFAFSVESQKNLAEICWPPYKTGPCRAHVMKYYYCATTDTCEMFVFGGCFPNDNSFNSVEQCEQQCTVDQRDKPSACYLPKDEGTPGCAPRRRMESVTRWYFYEDDGRCMTMEYKGCNGNQNNFPSERACMSVCGRGSSTTAGPTTTEAIETTEGTTTPDATETTGGTTTPEATEVTEATRTSGTTETTEGTTTPESTEITEGTTTPDATETTESTTTQESTEATRPTTTPETTETTEGTTTAEATETTEGATITEATEPTTDPTTPETTESTVDPSATETSETTDAPTTSATSQ